MFLSTVGKYAHLTVAVTKLGLLSAMEYRSSFLMKALGMLISDCGFLLLWVLYFQSFPSVNGWQFHDSALLLGISVTMYAFVQLFAPTIMDLADMITAGELDYFLTLPKNVLWQAATRRFDVAAVGDVGFGILMFIVAGVGWWAVVVALLLSVVAAGIFFNFLVFMQSITFWSGKFSGTAGALEGVFTGFTLYPQTVFHGALKVILMTIVPAYFVGAVPVALIKEFSWVSFLSMVMVWLVTFVLSQAIFNRGLKRYESGNLVGVKG